jgi:hypothetical protein
VKRRAGLATVLEDSQMICSVMVAVGSLIMIEIILDNDCSRDRGRRALPAR